MTIKTKITIPKPCQENWLEMTPLEQGRFCQLCQKNVFDFTTASDREILEAYNYDHQLCGRFTTSQLNRELFIRKEKSSIWVAATSAIVSFIGLGTNETQSQETIKVEQTDKKVLNDSIEKITNEEIEVSGIVSDEIGPLPGANIVIKGTSNETQTDLDGNFIIKAKKGDFLIISFISLLSQEIRIEQNSNINIILKNDPTTSLRGEIIVGVIQKKRTFFGRMFHSIGNWFR